MSNLWIACHNDDDVLWGAFTLCRESADIQVVVIFDGYVQALRGEPVTWQERRDETVAALKELGVMKPPIFAGFRDDYYDPEKIAEYLKLVCGRLKPEVVYVPKSEYLGHTQHNLIGDQFLGDSAIVNCEPKAIHYMTYTQNGKSVGRSVIPEPDWVIRKLRALACYKSQIHVANCREHFMRGLHEYYA